ncbi:hypothetical protein ScalyP_jg9539 [Parmales sp. scaly parma]|nr:hypothetical protein ScalyP_jg9539 [Parmales sp. scaly parma]
MGDQLFESIVESSNGDIRNAVMNLQFRLLGTGAGSKNKLTSKKTKARVKDISKDARLSNFHALGKILYAKRIPSAADSVRPPLAFHPERVLSDCDMSLSGILAFLLDHSVDFHTNMDDLSRSFDSFSDADLFLRRNYMNNRDRGDTIFPEEYAKSILGRGVPEFNLHPSENKFRQFSAPKIFDVERKKRENAVVLQRLKEDLERGSGTSVNLSNGKDGAGMFCQELLPFARVILPNRTNVSLHSHVRDNNNNSRNRNSNSSSAKVDKNLSREEREERRKAANEDQFMTRICNDEDSMEVLMFDDIVDSDDDIIG